MIYSNYMEVITLGFEPERMYSTQEISDITGIPRVSLAMYARQGRIKAVKVGKNWKMLGAEVTRFLDSGTKEKPQGEE